MAIRSSEAVRAGIRLAFAHHPLCRWFAADRFGPLCSGCALFWPTLLATTPFVVLQLVQGTSAWAMLAASAVLGAPQLVTAVVRLGRLARGAVKVIGGAAVAMAVLSIAWLPVAWPWRAAFYAAMAVAFAVLATVRVRSILRTCDACPWQRDWEHCPGFRIAHEGVGADPVVAWQDASGGQGPAAQAPAAKAPAAVDLEARAD